MKRLPVPSPHTLRRVLDHAKSLADDVYRDYDWLYPSAFTPARHGATERTRREIGSASGTLADVVSGTASVRHHVADAARRVDGAVALLRGALKALGSAQSALDAERGEVADDPLEPASSDRAELARLREAQERRVKRARAHELPWSSEEVYG